MSRAADVARELFLATLADIDIDRVVRRSVRYDGDTLAVGEWSCRLESFARILLIAVGKASLPMAHALTEILVGDRVPPLQGVVVTNERTTATPQGVRVITGGHPTPDAGSFEAGREVLEAVRAANSEDSLILFAISGGGSSLCECPILSDLTLADLRAMNGALISCGAVISEINTVRRRVSAIKGGRLAAAAPRATQVSFFASDVNPGDLSALASGLTVAPRDRSTDAIEIVERYDLQRKLPPSVIGCLALPGRAPIMPATSWHEVLIDNAEAVSVVQAIGKSKFGLRVEALTDLLEAPVEDVAQEHVVAVRSRNGPACVVSGGEAVCPVRGPGRGGRNHEMALRAAIQLSLLDGSHDIAVLSAGTDGVDGNSPAAGAVADCTTVTRGAADGMRAADFLDRSDSYSYFAGLGDSIVTGPTGNNVRDLRISVVWA